MSSPTSAPVEGRCLLLELPAETRNRIYEEVLLETSCGHEGAHTPFDKPLVHIHRRMPDDWLFSPALLRTCKQIREEAASIYYLSQVFLLDTPDLDPAQAISFTRQARGCIGKAWWNMHIRHGIARQTPNPSFNWLNLLQWLKAYYDLEVNLLCSYDSFPEQRTMFQAFRIVTELRMARVSWCHVEEVLGMYKMATRKEIRWYPDV